MRCFRTHYVARDLSVELDIKRENGKREHGDFYVAKAAAFMELWLWDLNVQLL